MTISQHLSRVSRAALTVAIAVPVVAFGGVFQVALIEKAAGIPSTAKGIGQFISTAQSLVTPALAMTAAIAPLTMIAGGLLVLLGSRRGWQIIITAVGVLLLLGSVTALID